MQDVTECKEIICFGLAYASLIIADRTGGDIELSANSFCVSPAACRASRMIRADSGWGRVDIRFTSIRNYLASKKGNEKINYKKHRKAATAFGGFIENMVFLRSRRK